MAKKPAAANLKRTVLPMPGSDQLRVEQGCTRCEASIIVLEPVPPSEADPTQPDIQALLVQLKAAGWKINTAGEVSCGDCR